LAGHYARSLCITGTGQLFVPQYDSPDVLVFDSDGSSLPSMPVEGLGLTRKTPWAAYANGDSPALLLADYSNEDDSSMLVAVDATTRAVRWATARGWIYRCGGVAVLPDVDIVAVVSAFDGALVAHRLSDGARVARLEVPLLCSHLASDPATGAIYGNVRQLHVDIYNVVCFSCTLEFGLRRVGDVPAAGDKSWPGPLCVAPPSSGKTVSHLIVTTSEASTLLVLSLPDLVLVHTHALGEIKVCALSSDPWGAALAVSDSETNTIHVLSWPLPGMAALE